jgi:hypothetical protein
MGTGWPFCWHVLLGCSQLKTFALGPRLNCAGRRLHFSNFDDALRRCFESMWPCPTETDRSMNRAKNAVRKSFDAAQEAQWRAFLAQEKIYAHPLDSKN